MNVSSKADPGGVSINPDLAKELFSLIQVGTRNHKAATRLPYSTAGAHQIGRAVADYINSLLFVLDGGLGKPFTITHKSGSTTRVICKESEHGYAWDVKTTRANNRGYVDHIAKFRRDLYWQAQFNGVKPTFTQKDGEIKTLDYVVTESDIPLSVIDELAYTKHVILRLLRARHPFVVSGAAANIITRDIAFGFNAENAWLRANDQKVSE